MTTQARREWGQRNRESYLEDMKRRYHDRKVNDPAALLLKGAKERARKQGVPCTIGKGHIVIPDVCPILGIP